MSKVFGANIVPACAGFGPVFIAMGFLFPAPFGFFIALPGALVTSFALLTFFRMQTAFDMATSKIRQSSET
jgi:hypothetical protein